MANAAKDKVEGKLHEVKGAATGNKAEEARGKLQGAKADVEHQANKARKEADRKTGY
ncbi:MAG TPA: CsbD family protein [Chloroflexota bacterium]|nr:CsbD family protein [Chloroflexota bacterium]